MGGGIFTVVGVGVVAVVIAVTLRQIKPEFALMTSLCAGIFILYIVLDDVLPIVASVEAIAGTTGLPMEYSGILFKALGVCMLTQIACDTCRDAGESAIATKIEIAGRVSILAVSLPLFRQVLSIVSSLID